MSQAEIDDRLLELNKDMLSSEAKAIERFVKKKKWEMEETGTGLQYRVYEQGSGELVRDGQTALVHFTVSLLDGTECYTSRDGDPRTFKVAGSDVETGLHEGITYLRPGDKAHMILPSHLAHGLVGDASKIPPRSPIVYDIELIAVR